MDTTKTTTHLVQGRLQLLLVDVGVGGEAHRDGLLGHEVLRHELHLGVALNVRAVESLVDLAGHGLHGRGGGVVEHTEYVGAIGQLDSGGLQAEECKRCKVNNNADRCDYYSMCASVRCKFAHLEDLGADLHLVEGSDRLESVLLVGNSHLEQSTNVIRSENTQKLFVVSSLTLKVLLPLM